MKIFNLDLNKLVKLLLPIFLRKEKIIAFLNALISPLVKLYNRFILNRNNNLYILDITPQVFSLEKMLNDRYDNVDRRIYISNGAFRDADYIYLEAEMRPKFISIQAENSPEYLHNRSEFGFIDETFIIHIPASLIDYMEEMEQMTDAFKLVSRTFKIVTI